MTQADGAYLATISATSGRPLTLSNGYDTITGLPLGGFLGADSEIARLYSAGAASTGVTPAFTAPYNDTAISPLSSIVVDSGAGIDETAGVLQSLGLDPTLDLATLDPVKQAQAGDPAPLLTIIELLDTVTLLSPLNGYTFAPVAEALDGAGFSLDTASGMSTLIRDGFKPEQLQPSAAQLSEIAAIVAAGNAAIVTGQDPGTIVTGDFNGDGRLDLAVFNLGDGTTSIFLGKDDGTFTAACAIRKRLRGVRRRRPQRRRHRRSRDRRQPGRPGRHHRPPRQG